MSSKTVTSKNQAKTKTNKSDDLGNSLSGRFSTIGAPSQRTQSSRKGKRAWRKNVDITELEEGLEELREEERIIGGPVHKKTDEELFTIDLTGDAKIVRQRVKTKKPLTAEIILSQRSAVPAVFSKSGRDKGKDLTRAEKERLLSIAKRKRSGPFNSLIDTTELGQGSALLELSEAVKKSGNYDIWMDVEENTEDPAEDIIKDMGLSRTTALRDMITASAVSNPHQGTSYNPPVEAYQELLNTAVQVETKRAAEDKRYTAIKNTMYSARRPVLDDEVPTAEGMTVDIPDKDEENQPPTDDIVVPVKPTKRKTRQQKAKALKTSMEKRALKEKADHKKLLASLDRIKALKRDVQSARDEQERVAAQRKLEKMEQLRNGLVGRRFGRHKINEGDIDVQLGEDLSESLRGLKVEGSLFKDRFLSMQKRALVEPRTRVLPSRRKIKVKEFEKFSWKRFT
ncbi:tumor suppressor protein Gltscr2 [Serendipita vermifera]|nr:tumor suppressor protein Gltscr2 [Serendipita vermifera]